LANSCETFLFFAHMHLQFAKNANMTPKILFQSFQNGYKKTRILCWFKFRIKVGE
jgi:hypothetical protein